MPINLPPMKTLTKTIDPGLAQLGRIQQPAPYPQLNRTPAPTIGPIVQPPPGAGHMPTLPTK
jgi:hypothetical protein